MSIFDDRIKSEIARQPHFDPKYPHLADLNFAIESTLEMIEEMEYAGERHDWCHARPELLALLLAAAGYDDIEGQRDRYLGVLLDIADVLLQEDADTSGSWILDRIHKEVDHSIRVNP